MQPDCLAPVLHQQTVELNNSNLLNAYKNKNNPLRLCYWAERSHYSVYAGSLEALGGWLVGAGETDN